MVQVLGLASLGTGALLLLGPQPPPHRYWVACWGDWCVLGPSSLHLWRGEQEIGGWWATAAVRGQCSHMLM